jgi:hypothetical protein
MSKKQCVATTTLPLPAWKRQERAVITHLSGLIDGVKRVYSWDELGYSDQFEFGIIEDIRFARQAREMQSAMSGSRQAGKSEMIGMDGIAIMDDDSMRPLQIKHHSTPVDMNSIGTFLAFTALFKNKYENARDTLLVTTNGVTRMVKTFAIFFGYEYITVPDYTEQTETVQQQKAVVTVLANDTENETIDTLTDFNDSKNLRTVQINGLEHFKNRIPDQPFCISCYPGCGKTLMALMISLHLYKEEKIDSIIISTIQKTVTEQTMKRAEAFFKAHGIGVDVRLFDSDGDLTIAQFSSIKKPQLLVIMTTDKSSERLATDSICTDKTFTIFDECHHLGNETKALFQASKIPPLLMSGTISGMRADYIDEIDDRNHFTYSLAEAIADGVLCPYEMVIPVRPGLVNIPTDHPDFKYEVGLKVAFYMTAAMTRWVVICLYMYLNMHCFTDIYCFFVFNRFKRFLLLYCTTILEAQQMVIAMKAEAAKHNMNINCDLIIGTTSQKDRQTILNGFQEDIDITNTINVVVSVATLIEG